MAKIKNRKPAVILLAAILLVLVYLFFKGTGRETIKPAAPGGPAAGGEKAEAPRRTVTLFFLREADGLLHREDREILASESLADEARSALEELVRGSTTGLTTSLPAEAKIERVFVTKDGTAYVDFSRDLVDKHPSGSEAEIATVYSVVNTLAFNFKAIKKVAFLVEGAERETLSGHISLDKPFAPDYSLVAK